METERARGVVRRQRRPRYSRPRIEARGSGMELDPAGPLTCSSLRDGLPGPRGDSFSIPRRSAGGRPRERSGAHAQGAQRRDEQVRGPRDHQLLDLGRDREPRPVPGDPLHAGGVRGRGAARGRRGRLADPHPRPDAGRRAELRDRRLPRDHRGDPRRGPRRDRQLLDRRDRRPGREAARLPARADPRRRGAQHELDELREVLAAAQGLRLQGRVRELVRPDHRVPDGAERARDQARARVLRRRPRRQPRPADRHGARHRAAPDLARNGRDRRYPPELAEHRVHVRADPRRARCRGQLAGDRDLARPVEAARDVARPRRQRPRRARGQPLPARWRDGALERRPDRQGAADGRGRRPPSGDDP